MTSRKQDKKQNKKQDTEQDTEKDTNNVNLYEDLTDAILASMLTDADLIKFIDSNMLTYGMKKHYYGSK